MTDKILCRYYMNGACKYGRDCHFSHDMGEMPFMVSPQADQARKGDVAESVVNLFDQKLASHPQVCKYYLAGYCAYGDKCRYDHKRPDWAKSAQTKQSVSKPAQLPSDDQDQAVRQMQSLSLQPQSSKAAQDSDPVPSTSSPEDPSADSHDNEYTQYSQYDTARDSTAQPSSAWQGQHSYYYDPAYGYYQDGEYEGYYDPYAYQLEGEEDWDWDQLGFAAEPQSQGQQPDEEDDSQQAARQRQAARRKPSEQVLCSQYQMAGDCPRGERCHMAHGDLCQICGKFMLHPHNEEAREQHSSECQARHDRLAALRYSQGVECCVCMERVLDKPTAAERKFGLLSCEHAFCLGCIRGWRAHHEGGADTDTALRTCPVCRTSCWFVTPSSVWPASREEKDKIIAGYKAKLGSIDCRHWNFGENTCPFGTSCFYRHVYADGRPQEAILRKYGNSEGEVKIMQPRRLSDFIQNSAQRQPFRRLL